MKEPINPHKNQIELADSKGHVYLSFDNDDTTHTVISTPLGSLIIPEAEAVKMANEILNNYYGS